MDDSMIMASDVTWYHSITTCTDHELSNIGHNGNPLAVSYDDVVVYDDRMWQERIYFWWLLIEWIIWMYRESGQYNHYVFHCRVIIQQIGWLSSGAELGVSMFPKMKGTVWSYE